MRTRIFCTAKIHRATITGAELDYSGSVCIDEKLLESAGILPFEMVHINNINNGNHWETYVIAGKTGELTLHGAPARLFAKGDKIVVNRLENIPFDEVKNVIQKVVYVDDKNEEIKCKY